MIPSQNRKGRTVVMSNGDIHEISKEIGMFVSGLKAMKEEVQGFRAEFLRHNENMEAKVNGLLELKHRGAGLLLGISIIAGIIGAAITFAVQYLKGHGA